MVIEAGQTASLEIGPPLRNTVQVTRERNLLRLTYQLLGQAGEQYEYYDWKARPRFAVWNGPVKNRQRHAALWLTELRTVPMASTFLRFRNPQGGGFTDLGPLGPRDGPAVRVNCPVGDSLRSVAGWFVVVLLLLLRKANRVKEAWALLVPLLVVYLVLAVAERQLNAYLIFHIHQYICSATADLLRYFALSLAILLAIADRLDIPWRPVRFVLVFLFLLAVHRRADRDQ